MVAARQLTYPSWDLTLVRWLPGAQQGLASTMISHMSRARAEKLRFCFCFCFHRDRITIVMISERSEPEEPRATICARARIEPGPGPHGASDNCMYFVMMTDCIGCVPTPDPHASVVVPASWFTFSPRARRVCDRAARALQHDGAQCRASTVLKTVLITRATSRLKNYVLCTANLPIAVLRRKLRQYKYVQYSTSHWYDARNPGPLRVLLCACICAIYLAEGVFLGRELRPDRT